jgi:O-methyltransferase
MSETHSADPQAVAAPSTPRTKRAVQFGARVRELVPAPAELRSPGLYLRSLWLHRQLRRDDYTVLESRRARALSRLAADVEERRIPGALVDCGVYNGGSTVMLATGAPGRDVWAFDSFEGLPEPSAPDRVEGPEWVGECRGSEERVRSAFDRFADPAVLHIRKGWFEEIFPAVAREIDTVAVLHCDADWYESVLLTLETFYPKIPSGGYVVIDDYGHWVGARRAADEFRRAKRDSAPLIRIDYSGRYWCKP